MKTLVLSTRSRLPVMQRFFSRSFLMAAMCCLVSLPVLITAEVQNFAILLPPTDMSIHYANGYLRGPGASINLDALNFSALSEAFGTDDGLFFQDDKLSAGTQGDDKLGGDDGFAGMAGDDVFRHRRLDGGVEVGASQVDIVAFPLPDSCANSHSGCDWTTLGVGAKTTDGTLRWCCSQDSVDLGLCTGGDNLGRLIVQPGTFTGEQRSISVPTTGSMSKKLKNGIMNFDQTGRFVVVFANCNEHGREIMVEGNAVWKSKNGYLPGELFGFMYFYDFLFLVYLALAAWFGYLMKQNVASRIPIEKWIFMTIVLGLLELLFRVADYMSWNSDGVRSNGLTYVGILFGVLKHAISRCLVVMVSLGWGVVRDDLGSALLRIIILGIIYIGVAAAREFMILFAVEDMQTLSYDQEVELFDAATVLTFVVAAVDVIFIMWILDALNGTMQYLENMSQTRKLQRYLKFRTILLFAILFAVIWAVFSLVDTYDEDGIVREEHEWVVDAATEVNYLFVLIGVSWLWRPNPSAKEYAYVMELATTGGDGETELELTGGVVPSAMDDDEEPTGMNGSKGEGGRYQIANAERA